MKKSRLLSIILLLAIALTGVAFAQGQGRGQGRGRGNTQDIGPEPVLVYRVSGGFVTGPAEIDLIVYNDGTAILVRQDTANPEGTVCIESLSPEQVAELQADLRAAGALRLPDSPGGIVPDVPTTTVTVFANRGRSRNTVSNTFSYFVPERAYSQVEDVIAAFIAEVFPNC